MNFLAHIYLSGEDEGITIGNFIADILFISSLWIRNLFTSALFGLFVHTISFNNHNVESTSNWINYFGKISYGIYEKYKFTFNIVN